MKIVGIIPARYTSKRFPGKPLALIDGKPMIQHVYEQCKECAALEEVYVATDDHRIAAAVELFHGKTLFTSPIHHSGTDRCAEVAQKIEADAFINIQVDEIQIQPTQILQIINLLEEGMQIATLATKIDSNTAKDRNIVKLVKAKSNKALYFSRSLIPFESKDAYLQHIGIYGYQKEILLQLAALPPSALEISESLEQLRWLENDYEIAVDITDMKNIAIDTPEDLKKIALK